MALCLVAVSIGFVTADDKPHPREKLDTAILEGIRLLEAKEYAAFLKAFVLPEELKQITESVSMEVFAQQFGERKAPRLLEVLKEVKGAKPAMDPQGAEATYELKEEIAGKKKITFIKSGKLWYIKN
ncbi:MAG TPA: hypothetical protein PKD86_10740 [Gemmatales bacterium]|nr:hypothetical protein [Gemmatales bacterium]HMP59821.1 hypothetical protein [Gemmatales bacterium]